MSQCPTNLWMTLLCGPLRHAITSQNTLLRIRFFPGTRQYPLTSHSKKKKNKKKKKRKKNNEKLKRFCIPKGIQIPNCGVRKNFSRGNPAPLKTYSLFIHAITCAREGNTKTKRQQRAPHPTREKAGSDRAQIGNGS